MDKKLLSIRNYFQKGIKVGALATAVLMNAGCDPMAKDNQDTYQAVDYDQGLYQYIFLRHRFVEQDGEIHFDDKDKDKIAWANRHFNDAVAYMREKIADLQHKIYDLEPAGNFLQPICDEIFKDYKGDPDDGLNFDDLENILGQSDYKYSNLVGATIAKAEVPSYYMFQACYAMLGLRAYNDSLGYLHDSPTLPFNQERNRILQNMDSYNLGMNDTAAEACISQMIQAAAANTGVSEETLRDVINLGLLNAGLWGARDLGATAGFLLTSENKLYRPAWANLDTQKLDGNLYVSWGHYTAINYEKQTAPEQTR
ncbi:MAG: hypothetical protein J1G30_09430 [Spirochaetales bacterium]|nr:hypothetical protein [Spirochaetales bacterium]